MYRRETTGARHRQVGVGMTDDHDILIAAFSLLIDKYLRAERIVFVGIDYSADRLVVITHPPLRGAGLRDSHYG